MLLVLKNYRIVDETTDVRGTVIAENGVIKRVYPENNDYNSPEKKQIENECSRADIVLDGGGLVLMPAFVDLHAHFREPGFSEKETLESASLAAATGGYGAVACMANTLPATDTIAQALAIKNRSDALGLIDIYPVLSLTKGMEGKELSEITLLKKHQNKPPFVRLLSEDGKDVADDALFLSAMKEARRAGIHVSCHCDREGENSATKRAIELGKRSGCRLHIAHVSTKEAIVMIREAKKDNALLSCEVTPHHIALTEKNAAALGIKTHGRVNPPLRTEEDRQALIEAITDGTVSVIATDHAPHSWADKENGAPGFSGLETAFAVCYSTLVIPGYISLSKLVSLMSAEPAVILNLYKSRNDSYCGRGRITPGLKADFAIADPAAAWTVAPQLFKSRGKNSAFTGRELRGKIIMTIHDGRILCLE